MPRGKVYERYEVSGPGEESKSFADAGPGLSLSLTFASRATQDGTWYVRDAVNGDDPVGYTERVTDDNGVHIRTYRRLRITR